MYRSNNRIECWKPPTQAVRDAYPKDSQGRTIFPMPATRGNIDTKCTGNSSKICTPGWIGDPSCALSASAVDATYTKVAKLMVNELADMSGATLACSVLLGGEGLLECTAITIETGPAALIAGAACAALATFLCYEAVQVSIRLGAGISGNPNFHGSIWFREALMDEACKKVGASSDYDTFVSPRDLELRKIKEMFRALEARKGSPRAVGESLGWIMKKKAIHKARQGSHENFATPMAGTCSWGSGFVDRFRHPMLWTWDLISDALTHLCAMAPSLGGGAGCTVAVGVIFISACAAAEVASEGAATPFVAAFTAESGAIIGLCCFVISQLANSYSTSEYGSEAWKQSFKNELCKSNLGGLL